MNMMNQAESLWTMNQKLRGVADIRDVCHMTLYALLLKQTDMIWEEIGNAFPEISVHERHEIFIGKMGFKYEMNCSLPFLSKLYGSLLEAHKVQDVLDEYEKKYHIDYGILGKPYYELIRQMPKEIILRIFTAIASISVKSKEELYDIAEYLILKSTERAGRSMSECSTNVSLAKLEAKLLECDSSMTLYDGFCGSGISVNRTAAKDTKIYIRDIDLKIASIAAILCILGQKNIGRVECSDTLLETEYETKFDRIVSEPPFSVRYSKDYTDKVYYSGGIPDENIDGDGLPVFHCINQLKDDGKAVILLPMGFLFRGGKTQNVRRILLEMNVIDVIIELPEGCLPGTYAPSVLLILKKNRNDDNILMISAKSLFRKEKHGRALINDAGIDKIVDIYRRRAVIEGLSSAPTIEEIERADYGLSVAKYVVPVVESLEKESIKQLVSKYNEKQEQLQNIEKELVALRNRFIK